MGEARLVDAFGRRHHYLRISLTDLCNFQCVYCTPAEGYPTMPPSQFLTKQEILRFVKVIGRLGVHKVRLTGGEPLLRKDILDIVSALKSIESVKDLSLTTNGSRLKEYLRPLKEAGLDRLNISLDSLDALRFKAITLTDAYEEVMASVLAALEHGFPVKLNMVALQGLTRKEIVQFTRLAVEYPLEVRFLEFMPLCGTGWQEDLVLPIQEVRKIILGDFDLDDEEPRLDHVAQTFRIRGGKGKVGFIGSLTEPFCGQCSRLRLTADGRIRPCLFSDQEVPVRELLRRNASEEEIVAAIRQALFKKPAGNPFCEKPFEYSEGQSSEFECETLAVMRLGG